VCNEAASASSSQALLSSLGHGTRGLVGLAWETSTLGWQRGWTGIRASFRSLDRRRRGAAVVWGEMMVWLVRAAYREEDTGRPQTG